MIILTEMIRSPNDSELDRLSEKGTVDILLDIFVIYLCVNNVKYNSVRRQHTVDVES